MSDYQYDNLSFDNTLEHMRAKVLCGDWYYGIESTPSQVSSILRTTVVWC